MKRIIVISEGNAENSKTWSNIPYFLVNGLREKGYEVSSINVGINKYIHFIFMKLIFPFIKIKDGSQTEYKLNRTKFYHEFCKWKIDRCIKRMGTYDVVISTSYSFLPKKKISTKNIMLCDWTFEYHISHFKQRKPTKMELKAIKRQESIMKNADCIISLFPDVAYEMKKKYENVFYLGNVININTEIIEFDFSKKYKSRNILFIGGKRYIEGAIELIKAVNYLNSINKCHLQLHIIGMTQKDLNMKNDKTIRCYGYLNKSNNNEKKLYYDLIRKSKICVNTTPQWAAFSSIVEVMSMATPIITSKYDSFVKTFQSSFNNNYYSENDYVLISQKIIEIFNLSESEYSSLCNSTKTMVTDLSWSNYLKKLEEKF